MGFLNRESLKQIVDAPRDDTIFRSLRFTQNNVQSMRMPLSVSGSLIKFIIAAKLNHSDPSGWPILQVIKRVSGGSNVTAMTQLEPRPTGYLNVFECGPLPANIQPGVIAVSIVSTGQSRYFLAYLVESSSARVSLLVYVNVSNDNTVVTPPTTIKVETKLVSSTAPTTISLSTHSESSDTSTTDPGSDSAIVGGLLGTLVMILILLVVLIIIFIVFLTYRHKQNMKQFSPSSAKTMPANNRLNALDNVTYAPDSIPPASDQIMLSTHGGDGDGTGATGRGTGAMSSSHNNPQEVSSHVYVFIKINTQALSHF